MKSKETNVIRGVVVAVLLAAALAVGLGRSAAAPQATCTNSWIKAVDGSWFDAVRWSTGVVPTTTDDVCIKRGGAYSVRLDEAATIHSLTIGGGLNRPALQIRSTCTGDAILTATSGATIAPPGLIYLMSADSCSGKATLAVPGGTVTNNGSLITYGDTPGSRIVDGNLVNSSFIDVHAGDTLEVTDTYQQVSSGSFITHLASSSSYGRLSVSGSATLGGTLYIGWWGCFKPDIGDVFTILTAGSVTGSFSTAIQAQAATCNLGKGVYYLPTYSSTSVVLVVTKASVKLAPDNGPPGTSVSVAGSNFGPNEIVTLMLRDANGARTAFADVSTDGTGSFSTAVTIPDSAAVGKAKLTAHGTTTNAKFVSKFTVTP